MNKQNLVFFNKLLKTIANINFLSMKGEIEYAKFFQKREIQKDVPSTPKRNVVRHSDGGEPNL